MKAIYKIKVAHPRTLLCQPVRHYAIRFVRSESTSKPFLVLSKKLTTAGTRVKGSENLKADKELKLSYQGFLVHLASLSTLESNANYELLEKIHEEFYPRKGFFDQIAACFLYTSTCTSHYNLKLA